MNFTAEDRKKNISHVDIIKILNKGKYSSQQILRLLALPKTSKKELRRELKHLMAEDKVIRLRGGIYMLIKNLKILTGRFVQHKAGYGFVIPEQANESDVLVLASHTQGALPDDKVRVRVYQDSHTQRSRGVVISIIKRAREEFIGTFYYQNKQARVKLDKFCFLPEFKVGLSKSKEISSGNKVVVKIIIWPTRVALGEVSIVEVLGKANNPVVTLLSVIKQFNLLDKFSNQVLREAKSVAKEPDEKTWGKRLDLRQQKIVTIDGEDSRDFDDAVFCEKISSNSWRLGVHIADVAYYVEPNKALDLAARERGTSVYFPDKVLHMLPEDLACGVCSLLPNKDRLTVSVFMEINTEGDIVKTEFARSVIRSAARLTYEEVESVLQAKESSELATRFNAELNSLSEVAKALQKRRERLGSLNFDLPEAKIVLDLKGRVIDISRRERFSSHKLIENCMIAANEAVANYLRRKDVVTLYRIHEPPQGERLEEFKEFLKVYGYKLSLGKEKEISKKFQELLSAWQGKSESEVLTSSLLRAMRLAVYSNTNKGHFGLGSECYTHFTSPIRRYPDLMVHRSLINYLETGSNLGGRRINLSKKISQLADELSEAERKAEQASRELLKHKQLEFMEKKIDQIFSGIITGINNNGFFVGLEEYFVEGLVSKRSLKDDIYYFDEHKYFLKGLNTGQEFKLGQKVKVRVAEIDSYNLKIILELIINNRDIINSPRLNSPRIAINKKNKKSRPKRNGKRKKKY